MSYEKQVLESNKLSTGKTTLEYSKFRLIEEAEVRICLIRCQCARLLCVMRFKSSALEFVTLKDYLNL